MALLNKKTFGAAALGLMLATSPVLAQDQTVNHAPAQIMYENTIEAGVAATKYALENDAIGVIISYGSYDGAPLPHAFGERFVEEIEKLGEKAKYFVVDFDEPGVAVAYAFGRTTKGPMGAKEAAQSLSEIVEIKRNQRESFASLEDGIQQVALEQ